MNKNFFKSKTIQGLLITLIGVSVSYFHDLGMVNGQFENFVLRILELVATLSGITFAAYGRISTKGEPLTLKSDETKS